MQTFRRMPVVPSRIPDVTETLPHASTVPGTRKSEPVQAFIERVVPSDPEPRAGITVPSGHLPCLPTRDAGGRKTLRGRIPLDVGEGSFLIDKGEVTDC